MPEIAKRVLSSMENSKQFVPHWLLVAATAIALFAMAPLPTDYYRLLRWLIFAASFSVAVESFKRSAPSWGWLFGIVALVFNPIVQFHFDKRAWCAIDGMTSLLFIGRHYTLTKNIHPRFWRILRNPSFFIPTIFVITMGLFIQNTLDRSLEKQRKDKEKRDELAAEIRRKEESQKFHQWELEIQSQQEKRKQEERENKRISDEKRLLAEADRKAALQVSPEDLRRIQINNSFYESQSLRGELTSDLKKPITDVTLKVSIFRTIREKTHYEKGLGFVVDEKAREELVSVERTTLSAYFQPNEKRSFTQAISIPSLEYWKYVARAEVTGASYTR